MLTAAALMDSVAVFAQRALLIPADEVGGVSGIALDVPEFRRRLRHEGADRLADAAGQAGELWHAMKALRNPVAHTSGLSGVVHQVLGRPSESRITLTTNQADAIAKAARAQRINPADWGLQIDAKPQPMLEASRFLGGFALTAIATSDSLIDALADDLQAPPLASDQSAATRKDLPKLALLGGVSGRLP